jgi:apolipoprotein N-acyltransferase
MKVRELLQIEIWSKRTSRKILVWFGVVFGVLVVGFVSLYEIERHWLTPGERSAAKVALAQIDGLQDFASLSDEDFNAREKQAEAKVEDAKQAAVTERDDWVAFELSFYLDDTQSDQREIRDAVFMWERHLPASGLTTEFGKKLNLTGTELRSLTRVELHSVLGTQKSGLKR